MYTTLLAIYYNANIKTIDFILFFNLVDLYRGKAHIFFYFPVTNAVVCLPGAAEQPLNIAAISNDREALFLAPLLYPFIPL